MSLQDAREILQRAKAQYRHALRAVESHLRAAVAKDPQNIAEAKSIQADYATGLGSGGTLGGLTQPEGPVVPQADLDPADGQPKPPPAAAPAAPTVDGEAKAQAADTEVEQPAVNEG